MLPNLIPRRPRHRGGRHATFPTSRRTSPHPLPRALRVAAFTSDGLVALGGRLGFPVAVIHAVADPVDHLSTLARDEHACWDLGEDWAFGGVGGAEVDPLTPSFRQLRFDPRWLGGARPIDGIAVEGGSVLVTLPPGVDVASFRAHLGAALAYRRFDVAAARPGRVHGRRATGRPVGVAARYSRPGGIGFGSTHFKQVDDLYEFRPKHLPDLVSSILLARHRAEASRIVARLVAGPHRP